MKSEAAKIVNKMLKMGKTDWRSFIEHRRKPADWQDVVNILNHMTVSSGMLAEYVAQRTGDYCGNKADHADAVKAALTVRAKIRKAVGFSVPRAGEFTF